MVNTNYNSKMNQIIKSIKLMHQMKYSSMRIFHFSLKITIKNRLLIIILHRKKKCNNNISIEEEDWKSLILKIIIIKISVN